MTTIRLAASDGVPEPDENAIRSFLCSIGEGLHLCAIPLDGGKLHGQYFDRDIEAATAFAVRNSAAGHNVYFTPNHPVPNCGPKPSKSQISHVKAVFVDVDPPKDGSPFDKSAVFARLQADSPTVVVDSGNGLQAFWFLDTEIPATPSTIQECEDLNRALVTKYGGDPAATNIDRLMRMPGTVNRPSRAKRERGCVENVAQVLLPDAGEARATVCQLQSYFRSAEASEPEKGSGPGHVPDETLAEIENALNWIPSECAYDDWIRIGSALKSLGQPGRKPFIEWSYRSASADSYPQPEVKWEQLRADRTNHRVIFALAAQYGWRNPRETGPGPSHGAPSAEADQWPEPLAINANEWLFASASPRAIIANLLYADVGTEVAAGGTGKTTFNLWLAIHIALGIDFCGREILAPGPVIILTAEDNREILVARLRAIALAMFPHGTMEPGLQEAYFSSIRERVIIIDVSSAVIRLTSIDRDVVRVAVGAVDALISQVARFQPSLILIDPAVSFGVGEGRVNDAEHGLIEAARRLRSALKCAVVYVHHTGKANARERTEDQYSGRGGSAFADGARLVLVLNRLDPKVWQTETGQRLEAGETGLKIAIAKLSYCEPQLPIYVRRKGYDFGHVKPNKLSDEELSRQEELQVLKLIVDELRCGVQHSQKTLSDVRDRVGMSRDRLRSVVHRLIGLGELSIEGENGKSQWLRPQSDSWEGREGG